METDKNEQNPINSMSDADKYEKYAPDNMDWKTFGRLTLKALIIDIVLVFLIFSVNYFTMREKTVIDEYDGIPRYVAKQEPYSTRLRNLYWPFFQKDSQIAFDPKCVPSVFRHRRVANYLYSIR